MMDTTDKMTLHCQNLFAIADTVISYDGDDETSERMAQAVRRLFKESWACASNSIGGTPCAMLYFPLDIGTPVWVLEDLGSPDTTDMLDDGTEIFRYNVTELGCKSGRMGREQGFYIGPNREWFSLAEQNDAWFFSSEDAEEHAVVQEELAL